MAAPSLLTAGVLVCAALAASVRGDHHLIHRGRAARIGSSRILPDGTRHGFSPLASRPEARVLRAGGRRGRPVERLVSGIPLGPNLRPRALSRRPPIRLSPPVAPAPPRPFPLETHPVYHEIDPAAPLPKTRRLTFNPNQHRLKPDVGTIVRQEQRARDIIYEKVQTPDSIAPGDYVVPAYEKEYEPLVPASDEYVVPRPQVVEVARDDYVADKYGDSVADEYAAEKYGPADEYTAADEYAADKYGAPVADEYLAAEEYAADKYGAPVAEEYAADKYGAPVAEEYAADKYGAPVADEYAADKYGAPVADAYVAADEYAADKYGAPVAEEYAAADEYAAGKYGAPVAEEYAAEKYGAPAVADDYVAAKHGGPPPAKLGGEYLDAAAAEAEYAADKYGEAVVAADEYAAAKYGAHPPGHPPGKDGEYVDAAAADYVANKYGGPVVADKYGPSDPYAADIYAAGKYGGVTDEYGGRSEAEYLASKAAHEYARAKGGTVVHKGRRPFSRGPLLRGNGGHYLLSPMLRQVTIYRNDYGLPSRFHKGYTGGVKYGYGPRSVLERATRLGYNSYSAKQGDRYRPVAYSLYRPRARGVVRRARLYRRALY